MFHSQELSGAIHIVYNFVYANAAARGAASLLSTDIGKIALQSDTNNFYVLQNNSPLTWSQTNLGSTGGTKGDILVYNPTADAYQVLAPGTNGQVLTADSTQTLGLKYAASGAGGFNAPTIQSFLSGSGTYTTPISPAPLYIRVKMVGGGGGGGGAGSSIAAGSDGVSSTFGSILTAVHGSGATNSGGIGGLLSTITSPAYGVQINGGDGQGAQSNSGATTGYYAGGTGGGSALFGGGGSSDVFDNVGHAGAANTGGGGAGCPSSPTINDYSAPGGGASSSIEAIIPSPASTYAYVVGTGGAGGVGATGTGGNGADGRIIIEEFYQ